MAWKLRLASMSAEMIKSGSVAVVWAFVLVFINGWVIWETDRPIRTAKARVMVEKLDDLNYRSTWIYKRDRVCANVQMTHTVVDATGARFHVALTHLRAPVEYLPDGRALVRDVILTIPSLAKKPVTYYVSGTVACNWAQDLLPYYQAFPPVVLD